MTGRRRWASATVLFAVIAAAAAVVVTRELTRGGTANRSTNGPAATALATVERRTLATQTQFNGTLGYTGSYVVLARSRGTVTWLPRPGRVIRPGHVLYRVDGAPVVLLHGATPAYRALAAGATAEDTKGADVAQLNHNLVALGCARRSDVDSSWSEFNWATEAGVEALQRRLHLEPTGRLELGAVAFLPTAARVRTISATLGGPASGAVFAATSTTRTVTVALDAGLESEIRIGDPVTITLPDGAATPGLLSSVGRVASVTPNDSGGSGSGPTVPVTIRPTQPAALGNLDQALVEVSINDRTVRDVLAVPVDALLARAGATYAVEVVDDDGTHRLVPVRPGLFDDAAGRVQVSGAGLAAGQRVVVPGND